jgi:hypothetical protein
MFRKKDPQSTLFETSYLVPEAKARRLQASWAETFRAHALPLIDEALFAALYCDDNGRPNRPVQTVFGVLLLKEMFDLTDTEALEQLEFSLLWHHALALTPEEAHLPQKTLHNFRARLLAHDEGREAFAAITDEILEALGTQVSRQRLDSTHVISNIAVLSRLGLFCETIRHFLSTLKTEHPRLSGRVPARLRKRYLKEDGGATAYQDAPSATGQRRLSVCARDLYRLRTLFAGTAAEGLEAFALMQRLLDEQCDVTKRKQRPSRDDDDAGESGVPVVLKAAKQVSSASLQSPHDAEVTYNAHKGKGYEVQMAETCHEDNAVEVITHVAVTEACASDEHAMLPTLQALADRGQQPQEMVADTAFGSGDNAVAAERMGTELVSPVKGPTVEVEDVAPEKRPLTAADFVVDANVEDPAVCPAGHFATEQTQMAAQPNRVVLTFERQTCEGCALFHACPAQLNEDGDGYVLHVDLKAANIERRRRAIASGAFKERYRIRAGIEATASELKRRHGLGSLRVRGRWRVVLAVHLKALACNVKRMVRALMPKPGAAGPASG